MVGSPDDLLPDRGPVAARQALAAADALRIFDGRATVWVVVQRLLEVAGFVLIFLGALYGGMLVGQWVWVAVGLAVVVLAYEGPVAPLAGAEPKRWRTRWRVLLVAVVMVLILLRGMGALGSWVAANDLVFPVALAAHGDRLPARPGRALGVVAAPARGHDRLARRCAGLCRAVGAGRCPVGAPPPVVGAHRPVPRPVRRLGAGLRGTGSRGTGGSGASVPAQRRDHRGGPRTARRVDVRAHEASSPALSRGRTRPPRRAPT